jgi:hypothetical protein
VRLVLLGFERGGSRKAIVRDLFQFIFRRWIWCIWPRSGCDDSPEPVFPLTLAVQVQENGAEPSEELAGAVKAGEALPCGDEGLLREVFGGGIIGAVEAGLTEEAGLMLATEFTESDAVAGARHRQEVGRIHFACGRLQGLRSVECGARDHFSNGSPAWMPMT